ncbi:DNA polymerase III subunit psi [Vibrio amylolyticus]|uniref:DNA polymerase III subunit psi n=1 Tax=Vibrio amylolyticus TaxID=2847292 RepID=UPI0035531A1A
MQQRDLQYLQEMGIDSWQLNHPDRLDGYQAPRVELNAECRLLLVSTELPSGDLAVMFERVLKSVKLTLDQAQHIYPEQLHSIHSDQLVWIWYAGTTSVNDSISANKLLSPLLSDIDGNNTHRRALWQQICSYE